MAVPLHRPSVHLKKFAKEHTRVMNQKWVQRQLIRPGSLQQWQMNDILSLDMKVFANTICCVGDSWQPNSPKQEQRSIKCWPAPVYTPMYPILFIIKMWVKKYSSMQVQTLQQLHSPSGSQNKNPHPLQVGRQWPGALI